MTGMKKYGAPVGGHGWPRYRSARMRWIVPMNVPSSVNAMKSYDGGGSGSPMIGRPQPGSLQLILGFGGSRKHVHPAAPRWSGFTPTAVAPPTETSAAASAVMRRKSLRIGSPSDFEPQ